MSNPIRPTPPQEPADPQTSPDYPGISEEAGDQVSTATPPARPQQPAAGLPRLIPWSLAVLVAVIIALVIVVAAVVNGGDSGKPLATARTATASDRHTTAAPTSAAPPPVVSYHTPAKDDFKLGVKILKKQCFGSAGCNITYRIDVTYVGGELDPSKTYEVTYQVKGAEDPIVNTLEVTGDSASVQQEEIASTRRSSAKLTAVVSDVSEL